MKTIFQMFLLVAGALPAAAQDKKKDQVCVPVEVSSLSDLNFSGSAKRASLYASSVTSVAGKHVVVPAEGNYKGEVVAGSEIRLKPGFEVKQGAEMRFAISKQACNDNVSKINTDLARQQIAPKAETLMVELYPNPTTGHFVLTNNFPTIKNEVIEYVLLTVDGKQLSCGRLVASASYSFDLSKMARGVYMVKVLNKNTGFNVFKRVVIQ